MTTHRVGNDVHVIIYVETWGYYINSNEWRVFRIVYPFEGDYDFNDLLVEEIYVFENFYGNNFLPVQGGIGITLAVDPDDFDDATARTYTYDPSSQSIVVKGPELTEHEHGTQVHHATHGAYHNQWTPPS